jgi:hypothetical protein
MSWRLGMLDVSAIMVLLVILFMPPPTMTVIGAFDHRAKGDKPRDVQKELTLAGDLQTQLWKDPGNGEIADKLAAQMSDLGRFDMAFRIGGKSASIPGPSNWRALVAVSDAYAESRDISACFRWADKALSACHESGTDACPAHEEVRLRLHVEQLRIGVGLKDRGFDPKIDPNGFRRELSKGHPTTRTGSKNDK